MLSRRRKIILVCAALGVGGYASYRIYRSSYVSRKRQRLASFMASMATLVEAFAEGIDSTSVVASDFKAFLLSDVDQVPRSLKQCLKIMSCREFQEALTSFSACVSRGVVDSIVSDSSWIDRPPRILQRQRSGSSTAADAHGTSVCVLLDQDAAVNESDKHVLTEEVHQGGNRNFTRNSRGGLPERLMETLFTDAGKGFASVVLGSVAKNTTLSFLEGLSRMKHQESMTSEWDSRGLAPDVCNLQETPSEVRVDTPGATLLDLASSSKGRSLIAECIQAFVGTAVSVYLDKTKDVNIYEDLVAGVTKPSHQPAMKELLTSVCSGAVETLVRTSHEVLLKAPSERLLDSPLRRSCELGKAPLEEQTLGETSAQNAGHSTLDTESRSTEEASTSSDICYSLQKTENPADPRTMIVVTGQGGSKISLPNWVAGLSRTLAVPSNRRLLIDVAGTVTSEAIHSFFEVLFGVLSPYLRGSFSYTRPLRNLEPEQQQQQQQQQQQRLVKKQYGLEKWVAVASSELFARSLVIMTVCFAILLHVVVDIGVLEP